MKALITTLILLFISSTSFSQSLENQLLGKWKLTKDEGYEFFINSPEAQMGDAEQLESFMDMMEDYHANNYKNFYSLDSMTSTILDRREVVQEKSHWNVRAEDSVITWTSQFHPKVLQAKIHRINQEELVLIYLTQNQEPGQFQIHYKKEESVGIE